jgi:hypothetical protein
MARRTADSRQYEDDRGSVPSWISFSAADWCVVLVWLFSSTYICINLSNVQPPTPRIVPVPVLHVKIARKNYYHSRSSLIKATYLKTHDKSGAVVSMGGRLGCGQRSFDKAANGFGGGIRDLAWERRYKAHQELTSVSLLNPHLFFERPKCKYGLTNVFCPSLPLENNAFPGHVFPGFSLLKLTHVLPLRRHQNTLRFSLMSLLLPKSTTKAHMSSNSTAMNRPTVQHMSRCSPKHRRLLPCLFCLCCLKNRSR